MPDRPPLIDVAAARGAGRTGGPIPPTPEILDEVAAVRGSAAEGEVLTFSDGRPVWLPGGGGVTAVDTVADLPPNPAGHPVRLVLEGMTLHGWDGAAWVPLASGAGGADFIDIPVVLASFANGDMLVWDGDDFLTEVP